MSKRATNSEVNSKIGSSLTPAAKCPTKKEIVATGKGTVSGYSDNQLVDLSSVTKKNIVVTFRVNPIGYYEVQIGGRVTINGTSYNFNINSNGTNSWSKEITDDKAVISGNFTAGYRTSQFGQLMVANADPMMINETLTSSNIYRIKCKDGIN